MCGGLAEFFAAAVAPTVFGGFTAVDALSDGVSSVVPVGALLALAEGGYGLQVVGGGTPGVIAVTTGLFADGRVEVSGPDLREGMTVGMAR